MPEAVEARRSYDWTSALRIVDAARPWFDVCREELEELLKESDGRLRNLGLAEPLYIDLGMHRWLQGSREEAYSDWLAWIIEQLLSADAFDLFGLTVPDNLKTCDRRPKAYREEWILNNTRRLDIRICFDTLPSILIEVKTGSAENADIEKNRDYEVWARKQDVRHKLLLVTGAEKSAYYGFTPVFWDDICVKLRKSAPKFVNERGTIVGAMVIAFVGAVERNLLSFSAPGGEGAFSREWPHIARHIERSLDKEEAHEI